MPEGQRSFLTDQLKSWWDEASVLLEEAEHQVLETQKMFLLNAYNL